MIISMADQPKSLAHPEWPYSGTPWAWRGFTVYRPLTKEEDSLMQQSLLKSGKHLYDVVYQKQNFGPELD